MNNKNKDIKTDSNNTNLRNAFEDAGFNSNSNQKSKSRSNTRTNVSKTVVKNSTNSKPNSRQNAKIPKVTIGQLIPRTTENKVNFFKSLGNKVDDNFIDADYVVKIIHTYEGFEVRGTGFKGASLICFAKVKEIPDDWKYMKIVHLSPGNATGFVVPTDADGNEYPDNSLYEINQNKQNKPSKLYDSSLKSKKFDDTTKHVKSNDVKLDKTNLQHSNELDPDSKEYKEMMKKKKREEKLQSKAESNTISVYKF